MFRRPHFSGKYFVLKESMIDAGKAYLKDEPVLVEVSVADNWYEK
jgi:hypothetical protein